MITDIFLNETAKAINNESYSIPSHQAVGTTEITAVQATDTSISGEIGGRVAVTRSRTSNQVEITALRTAVSVVDSVNGDSIKSTGIFDAASDGNFLTGVAINGVTQQTSFDVEFVTTLTVNRK